MPVRKEHIVAEIRRLAKASGGVPPGWRRFYTETGIKETDWLGRHWPRWSEALREAGFAPNELQSAYDESDLLERLAALSRELGRLPAKGDLLHKSAQEPSFPNAKTFQRLGSKAALVAKLQEFCENRDGFDDILSLCAKYVPPRDSSADAREKEPAYGFVYLLKSGRFYKIGRSNSAGRRERELAIQLPQKAQTVHVIQTDDPVGIEVYWHRRFETKRGNGEWFDLDANDLRAFKRRKFM